MRTSPMRSWLRWTNSVVTPSHHIRMTITFHGQVQGVGFRMKTEHIASGHAVTGWVRNQPDGTVECVVEGESSAITGFLDQVRETMSGYIVDTHELQAEATGEFTTFEVRYL